MAVRGPRQPVVVQRACRRTGAGDEHRAVGLRRAARKGHLEVGNVAGVAGQARPRPTPVSNCAATAGVRSAEPPATPITDAFTRAASTPASAARRASPNAAAAPAGSVVGLPPPVTAPALLPPVGAHHEDARRRAAEVAAEGQDLRMHKSPDSGGYPLVSHRFATTPDRPLRRIARSCHRRPRLRWLTRSRCRNRRRPRCWATTVSRPGLSRRARADHDQGRRAVRRPRAGGGRPHRGVVARRRRRPGIRLRALRGAGDGDRRSRGWAGADQPDRAARRRHLRRRVARGTRQQAPRARPVDRPPALRPRQRVGRPTSSSSRRTPA